MVLKHGNEEFYRIECFRVTREQVKVTQVLKFFLLNGAVDFFSVDFESTELKMG